MHVRDASTDNSQALTATPKPLPNDATTLTLGPFSEWADNGFAFADIACVDCDYPGQCSRSMTPDGRQAVASIR